MEPLRTPLAFLALAATLFGAGCGTGAGGVCDHLVDCELIEQDDFPECKRDIRDAVKEGDIDRSDVQECKRCSYENGCGLELLVDCFSECGEVWAYIDGSGF